MADINKIVPLILHFEGGFVNHPDDPGGATNKGITLATYATYCRRKGYPQPTVLRLKEISDDTWMDIFRTMFWNRCLADQIESQSVANIIVDWYFNAGRYAIQHVQRIVGVTADGILGPNTLQAINSKSPLPLFGQIKLNRKKYYESLCTANPRKKVFLRGWLNRVNSFTYED